MNTLCIRMLTACLAGALLVAGAFAAVEAAPDKPDKPVAKGPFGGAPAVTVAGTVADLALPDGNKRIKVVSFTVVNGETKSLVQVAPVEVLKLKGLELANAMKISVSGWQLPEREGKPGAIQAGTISVGDKSYEFYTPKGESTWTQFDLAKQVTLQGTIKDIVIPAPPEKPAEGAAPPAPVNGEKPKGERNAPKPPTMVSFTLVINDKETCNVIVGPPQILEHTGLQLVEGGKISVAGWQMKDGVVLREATIGDKVVALRDAHGKFIGLGQSNKPREGKPRDGKPKDGQAQ